LRPRAAKAPGYDDLLLGVEKMRTKCLLCPLLFWAGTDSQFDEPFFDIGADDIGMVLLQVVKTGAKLHQFSVLQSLRKGLSEGRRYQGTRISCEKQLWVRRLRQSTMRFLQGCIHIRRFSRDRQFIGEARRLVSNAEVIGLLSR
jgi:hypothetical protein